MKKIRQFNWVYVNGKKQTPKDLDFTIVPTLIFAEANKDELENMGSAYALCVSWGYWAFGIGLYTLYLEEDENIS